MKRQIKNITIGLSLICLTIYMAGCGKTEAVDTEESTTPSTTISGSFTATFRDIIPDYCFDDVTPCVAVVSDFQSYPYTVFVGEELGAQLQPGEVYVFSIEPVTVKYSKEELEGLYTSSLVWEIPGLRVIDARPAEDDELGLSSLYLTITENE